MTSRTGEKVVHVNRLEPGKVAIERESPGTEKAEGQQRRRQIVRSMPAKIGKVDE